MQTALGFKAHTGWAAAVLVGDEGDRPVVLARDRVELNDPDLPGQAYHASADLPLGEAAALVARSEAAATAGATAEIGRLVEAAGQAGHDVVAVGVPVGNARIPSDLAAILKSHMLLHAAEGELFRTALAEGAAAAGLKTFQLPARELPLFAAEALGLATGAVAGYLTALGKPLGKPWTADQKDATVIGWLALRA